MKQLCDILGAETVDSIPYRLNEVLFYGDSDRDPIYRAICDMYANDLSYDWFYDFYQSLYAQRKDLKQDFTPKSISDVLLRISSSDSAKITYEPSAGLPRIRCQRSRSRPPPSCRRPERSPWCRGGLHLQRTPPSSSGS